MTPSEQACEHGHHVCEPCDQDRQLVEHTLSLAPVVPWPMFSRHCYFVDGTLRLTICTAIYSESFTVSRQQAHSLTVEQWTKQWQSLCTAIVARLQHDCAALTEACKPAPTVPELRAELEAFRQQIVRVEVGTATSLPACIAVYTQDRQL